MLPGFLPLQHMNSLLSNNHNNICSHICKCSTMSINMCLHLTADQYMVCTMCVCVSAESLRMNMRSGQYCKCYTWR